MIELYPCGNRTHCQELNGDQPNCNTCPHNLHPKDIHDCNTCKHKYEKKEDDNK
jgi:hypothetical protein